MPVQLYFPNFKTKQGAIGMFDYLLASRDSNDNNVIFNSDLNLEDLSHLPSGTHLAENNSDNINNSELYSFLGFVIQNLTTHNAQVFQDLYVLWKLKNKKQGIFVEIGTGYPTGGNNTWILESQLDWHGVLVEPNPTFSQAIQLLRKSELEPYAIYYESDVNLMLQVPVAFSPGGGFKENFENIVNPTDVNTVDIPVKTISMSDLLKKHQIPKNFDYLSFDTTGNSLDISALECMFVDQYFPKIITIGHNYKSHRTSLHNMLQSHGYVREFDYLSKWDDWYYHL
jgi:hypothetical protein